MRPPAAGPCWSRWLLPRGCELHTPIFRMDPSWGNRHVLSFRASLWLFWLFSTVKIESWRASWMQAALRFDGRLYLAIRGCHKHRDLRGKTQRLSEERGRHCKSWMNIKNSCGHALRRLKLYCYRMLLFYKKMPSQTFLNLLWFFWPRLGSRHKLWTGSIHSSAVEWKLPTWMLL